MSVGSGVKLDLGQLIAWGEELGRAAVRHRVFVALEGPLGAGKTTLVRAACDGAGLAGPVTSPTFTLIHRYGAQDHVYHVDLYRIASPDELEELGWDDLTNGEHTVFVEWAGQAGDLLPVDRWTIRLDIADGGSVRTAEFERHGRAPAIPVPR